MTSELTTAIHTAILSVATELDARELDALDPDADFRDELDLDSMDFLNVLIAIARATGVAIPEADYQRVHTLSGLAAYLESRHQAAARR